MSQTLRAASQTAPADRVAAVVPDDAADLPLGLARGLYVGGGGALRLRDAFGGEVTLISAGAQYHPIRVARVLASGTAATDIIALY